MPGPNSTFRTVLTPKPLLFKLGLQSRVITAGSCFSQVIGSRLQDNKVDVLNNPFGTIFNPPALFRLLNASVSSEYNFEHDLTEQQGIWYSHNMHSSFSAGSKKELLMKIDEAIKTTSAFIKTADVLVITFGTAVAYKLNNSGKIVANCHKVSQQNFTKKILSASDIVNRFYELYDSLLHINPRLKILLTVSPVRHIKDTLEINSVSKAVLRLVCHELCADNPQNIFYFPSYEIMMDDLRDYRFYGSDMLHPSILAEDYIWQYFTECCFDDELKRFLTEWQYVQQALEHRPFHPESAAHQQFIRNVFDKLQKLQHDFQIDVSEEITMINSRLPL